MVTGCDTRHDSRMVELAAWLDSFGDLAGQPLEPASGDASFRRYFRIRSRDGTARIVMDAPPEREDTGPFVTIAGWLRELGLNAPEVLARDTARGFVLLTDLGQAQYLRVLEERPETADRLYGDALAALARLQEAGARYVEALPPYDARLLRFELSLFHEWLCERHLGVRLRRGEAAQWEATVDCLVEAALDQPQVFVHRDYHSRNLMVTPRGNPGILDFQDAVRGPLTYDPVSLLKDCYIRWPADRVQQWALSFRDHAGSPAKDLDRDLFLRSFDLMGVHRHLKAAGIFARLKYRDAKPSYLPEVPRTLRYVQEAAARYDELAFLGRLIERRCLPRLEPR